MERGYLSTCESGSAGTDEQGEAWRRHKTVHLTSLTTHLEALVFVTRDWGGTLDVETCNLMRGMALARLNRSDVTQLSDAKKLAETALRETWLLPVTHQGLAQR